MGSRKKCKGELWPENMVQGGEWRELHYKNLHNLHSSSDTVNVIIREQDEPDMQHESET
jgi:hypothetical protein